MFKHNVFNPFLPNAPVMFSFSRILAPYVDTIGINCMRVWSRGSCCRGVRICEVKKNCCKIFSKNNEKIWVYFMQLKEQNNIIQSITIRSSSNEINIQVAETCQKSSNQST